MKIYFAEDEKEKEEQKTEEEVNKEALEMLSDNKG